MRRILENFSLFFFLILFLSVAHAQQVLSQGFGSDLNRIAWSAWGWVFLFSAVGIMARLQVAIKEKEFDLSFFSFLSWVFVGLFASFLAFAACEFIKIVMHIEMPDLLECAIISVAAYNNKVVINGATQLLRKRIKSEVEK